MSSGWSKSLGPGWQRLRAKILKRDGYLCRCRHCKASGRVRVASEVDHILPRARGGTDEESNLQAINHDCHKRKTIEERGARPKQKIGLDGFPVASLRSQSNGH